MFPLRTMLRHHLEHNHYPAVRLTDDQFEQVVTAIGAANAGETSAYQDQILEAFHLNDPAFVSPGGEDE